jgi:YggT family protein
MIASIIYAIGGFIEALIGLRFALLLLGANPVNAFVDWVYQWSAPFVAPFAGIFGQSTTVAGKGVVTASVFDWTALIAFVVIAIIMALLGRILGHRHVAAM